MKTVMDYNQQKFAVEIRNYSHKPLYFLAISW